MKIDNCDDFKPFIDTYIDEEFDERDRAEFEAHMAHCEACRREVEFQAQFKLELREQLGAERAPDGLRQSIMGALEQEAASQAAGRREASRRAHHARIKRAGIMASPLVAALCVVLFLPAFTIAPATSGQLPMVEQTVDWHRGNLPLEIRGSQPEDVARWFSGKVDFPVRPPHFPHERAELIGARIANVQDRRAAYLLYEVGGARMSVMMFQGDGLKVPGDRVRELAGRDVALMNAHGYEVAVVQDSGITYTVTTDLSQPEFVKLMEEALER